MNTLNLSESEREALAALTNARSVDPDCRFEHVGNCVEVRGEAAQGDLRVARETLRRLGHLGFVRFTEERDGFGRRRWTFVLTGS